jgi:hypothetical protein
MIRFIRDPQPPYTAYKQGMVRDLGAALEATLIASGDAVSYTLPLQLFGITDSTFLRPEEQGGAVSKDGAVLTAEGGIMALSEVSPVQVATATGTAFTGAGNYRGVKVRAIVGGPQTITIYDALSATGTPIDVIVVNSLGTWLWDRPSDLLPGVGGRRPITTGIHVVISGGTSRTIDVMVEAA